MLSRDRFRGVIVGALVGDCLGAYWERQSWRGVHQLSKVKEKIAAQVEEALCKKGPVISYTDDTALTLALGESLVECDGLNPAHFAQRYNATSTSNATLESNTNTGYWLASQQEVPYTIQYSPLRPVALPSDCMYCIIHGT